MIKIISLKISKKQKNNFKHYKLMSLKQLEI